jgi:hypothetical protein
MEKEKENKSWIYREKDRARGGERVREEERLLLRKEKIAFTMIVTSLLTLYRKSHLCISKNGCIPRKEIARPQS